jgi:hypothetical protein
MGAGAGAAAAAAGAENIASKLEMDELALLVGCGPFAAAAAAAPTPPLPDTLAVSMSNRELNEEVAPPEEREGGPAAAGATGATDGRGAAAAAAGVDACGVMNPLSAANVSAMELLLAAGNTIGAESTAEDAEVTTGSNGMRRT